ARKLVDNGKMEIWAKPLGSIESGTVAVVLLNRSGGTKTIELSPETVGIDSNSEFKLRDLWKKEDIASDNRKFVVPKHGVLVLKIEGKTTGGIF
ncbi:MAG: glycoside hydrolase family 27 protein, partial [Flavobacteriales bacterium]